MIETFIKIRAVKVHYVEQGEGVPVLYVHGNLGSLRWYERVMDIPGCRTVALDMPNFGRSGPLEGEPDIDGYADHVAAFISARALDRPVLVGHSLGGAVAISLAARSPTLIRGLVLVDSAPPSGYPTPVERHPMIEMMRTSRAVLAQALASVVPTLKDEPFFNALVDEAVLMAAPAWIGNAEALGRFDNRGKCGSFPSPVLVLRGRRDIVITEAMARETVEAFPRARLETLEQVGHSAMVEDPSLFTTIVAGFVSGLAPGKQKEKQ
jgi:branched-chain amino acid transport system permease protein